jgi:hypothetical protein
MQIIPVELSKLRLQGTIRVPLYITQQRRNAMGGYDDGGGRGHAGARFALGVAGRRARHEH